MSAISRILRLSEEPEMKVSTSRRPKGHQAHFNLEDILCRQDDPCLSESAKDATDRETYPVWDECMLPYLDYANIPRMIHARSQKHLDIGRFDWNVYGIDSSQFVKAAFDVKLTKGFDQDER